MSLNIEAFAECSAYIRVQEKKLLTASDCERAADAGGMAALLPIIAQGGVYQPKTENDVEPALARGLAALYAEAYRMCGEDTVVADIPAAKHAFLNVKAEAKAAYATAPKPETPVYSELPADVAKAAREAADTAYKAGKSPAALDVAVDRAWAAHVSGLAARAENEFIEGYVRLDIDCLNLCAFVRANERGVNRAEMEALLLPGGGTPAEFFAEQLGKAPSELAQPFYFKHFGDTYRAGADDAAKSGHYAALERLADNTRMDYLKQAKLVAYGPEVLFAYILLREHEARQIRVLAAGARNGLSAAVIRERLRDCYV